ncbi:MAG: hypothetical protein ROW48_16255 [Bellilinea sp.]
MKPNSQAIAVRITLGVTAVFIFLIIFSRAMTIGFSHDEYQFVASAQLFVQDGLLPYQDYPFLHMPYQVFINAIGIILTPYHFLAARALTAIANFLSIVVISLILIKKWEKSRPLTAVVLIALASFILLLNPALKIMDGRALNHAFAGLFSLLAFFILQRASSRQKPAYPLFFVCGLFSAFAAGVRLSYLVVVPALIIGIVFDSSATEFRERIKRLVWFSAGILFGLTPILILFLLSPEAFYYGNFTYIRLNTIYREILGHSTAMTLAEKIEFFYERELTHSASAVLYGMTLLIAAYHAVRCRRGGFGKSTPLLTLFLLGMFLLAASFSPTPLWPQYFFAPVPFFILFIFMGLEISAAMQKKVPLIAILMLALLWASNQNYAEIPRAARSLSDPSNWLPIKAHQYSSSLKSHLDQGSVLTLGSSFVLEAGLDIYPVFTVGPFAWRTSPILARETRETYGVISPEDLPAFLAGNPPAAVLVGFGERFEGFSADDPGGLEIPFIRYARQNGYEKTIIYADFLDQQTSLWVKKE